MTENIKTDHHGVKEALHPRNPHRLRYDFKELMVRCPELGPYVSLNQYGDESINFADPAAVKMLNRTLLINFYGISFWDIPENYLCPPVPGRADYIHYIADLLSTCDNGIIPRGKTVSVLDTGTGANCIYPIIGSYEYGWRFTGSDIDAVSIDSAQKIINANISLTGAVELRMQKNPSAVFRGIVKRDELFDVAICNPPFHSSPENAASGSLRKVNNLNSKKITDPVLNFGGQSIELWTPGGEESFVKKMIHESSEIARQCLWFTTLISKKTTLAGVYKALKQVKALDVRTIDMKQGHKISRIAAWSFLDKIQQKKWTTERWR